MIFRYIPLVFLFSSMLFAQDIFHKCGMVGDASSFDVRMLNQLKNRYVEPTASDYDTAVTLQEIFRHADDEHAFKNSQAVSISGYVQDIEVGEIESCNCHAKDALYRDTRLILKADPNAMENTFRVVVEITPRWRAKMKALKIDWTTRTLRRQLLHHRVKVSGWMLFDNQHIEDVENRNKGNTINWKETTWEVHPVTSLQILK